MKSNFADCHKSGNTDFDNKLAGITKREGVTKVNHFINLSLKATKILSLLMIGLTMMMCVMCDKDNQQSSPTFKNIEFNKSDFEKIVTIGKVNSAGLPVLNENLRGALTEGILVEPYTYQRLFPQGTEFKFDEGSLKLFTFEPHSGIYYLSIRGMTIFPEEGNEFIIAYQLIIDSNGNMWNMTKTQHLCTGAPCTGGCEFTRNGNQIVGCQDCPDGTGKCNHSTFEIEKGGYLIIPVNSK